MKKTYILFILLISFAFAGKTQTNCNQLCVYEITIDNTDTLNCKLKVNVINTNDSATQINYPIVQVVDTTNDTIANIAGLSYYFAQAGGSTLTHTIKTTLKKLPNGFMCTVYIKDGSTDSTCAIAYPSVCSVGINELSNNNHLTIYPNPASDNIQIQFETLTNQRAIVNLYNYSGQIIKTYSTTNNHLIINREGLNNGIYFVEIITANKRLTNKLIIE